MDAAAFIELNHKAAGQGSAEAMFNLGLSYFTGFGVRLDKAVACDWWRKAAEHGDLDAQYNLGIVYGAGDGVPVDKAASAAWLHKAACQGHTAAKNKLSKAEFVPTKGRKRAAKPPK